MSHEGNGVPATFNAMLFNEPRHLRRDARDIVKILQFGGIFTPEEIKELIRRAKELADKAAVAGKQREYAWMMRVLIACAQLEQRETPLEISHTGIPDTLEVVVTKRDQIPLLEEVARNVGGTTSTG